MQIVRNLKGYDAVTLKVPKWQPVQSNKNYLSQKLYVEEILEKTFGDLPLTLGEEDLDKLQAMANVVGYVDERSDNPFQALVEAIKTHVEIVVSKEV